jgi:hypothetical protein
MRHVDPDVLESAPGPEKRIELGNPSLRLDFDPRTSDTMYNYIWIRRPDTGRWLPVHNSFAFVALEDGGAGICNFYDNWQCPRDFWKASLNQQFIPDAPP